MYRPKKIKLKNGFKWEVSFLINGVNSKKIRRRFDKKVEAELFIKNFVADKSSISKSETLDQKTLSSEIAYWLSIRSEEVSLSHLLRIERMLTLVSKDYGHYAIERVDGVFLSRLRSNLLAKGLSPGTVNRWTSAVTTVVNFSYKHKRIGVNPCHGFGQLNENTAEMQFWEQVELSRFLAFTNKKYPEHHTMRWVHIVYLIALNTGLRAGEIWGLKVKDINLDRKFIRVERQFLKEHRKFSVTKGKNIRNVPCNSILRTELQELMSHRETRNSLLFKTENETAIFHSNFRSRFFDKDIKESGTRPIRFHDLRHTSISMMVDSGISLNVVQAIAGHANIKTTMKYVHLLGSSIENVADSFVLS